LSTCSATPWRSPGRQQPEQTDRPDRTGRHGGRARRYPEPPRYPDRLPTDGRAYTDAADHTCQNWTSASGGTAQVGHSDRSGGGNVSWNSTHATRGCSQDDLRASGGDGLLYCSRFD
jgi:hypothetical protein